MICTSVPGHVELTSLLRAPTESRGQLWNKPRVTVECRRRQSGMGTCVVVNSLELVLMQLGAWRQQGSRTETPLKSQHLKESC